MIEVGIREFRANLPLFLRNQINPWRLRAVAKCSNVFIPSKRRTPSEAQDAALLTAVARMREFVAEMAVDEAAVIANFKRAREDGNSPKSSSDLIVCAKK